jgi:hypothetical protein
MVPNAADPTVVPNGMSHTADATKTWGMSLPKRVALRQLLDGELIQVGVGKANAGNLQPDVGDLDRDVRRELPLRRRVPLLHGFRPTARRVSPMRSSFSKVLEKIR